MATVKHLSDSTLTVRCPQCGRESPWQGNRWRPFCSERCAQIDLGVWLSEGYAIRGESAADGTPDGKTEPESWAKPVFRMVALKPRVRRWVAQGE